jgi:hypothetical protein
MTDIQSAAERYRGYSDFCKTEHDKGFNGIVMPYRGVTADAIVLADAYLSLVPADSDVAITEDWLRSVGGKWDDKACAFRFNYARLYAFVRVDGHWWLDFDASFCGKCGTYTKLTTRGKFRQTFDCLGIPLERPQ